MFCSNTYVLCFIWRLLRKYQRLFQLLSLLSRLLFGVKWQLFAVSFRFSLCRCKLCSNPMFSSFILFIGLIVLYVLPCRFLFAPGRFKLHTLSWWSILFAIHCISIWLWSVSSRVFLYPGQRYDCSVLPLSRRKVLSSWLRKRLW